MTAATPTLDFTSPCPECHRLGNLLCTNRAYHDGRAVTMLPASAFSENLLALRDAAERAVKAAKLAEKYVAETPSESWAARAYDQLCVEASRARCAFEKLATSAAILALLDEPSVLRSRCESSSLALREATEPKPFAEWHEDYGYSVLWWRVPVQEPPYLGSPDDEDWPFTDDEESVLWWTPINPAANAVMARVAPPKGDSNG